jgi:hypothetical protein
MANAGKSLRLGASLAGLALPLTSLFLQLLVILFQGREALEPLSLEHLLVVTTRKSEKMDIIN